MRIFANICCEYFINCFLVESSLFNLNLRLFELLKFFIELLGPKCVPIDKI